ncbi:MAG: YitT family protein [Acholeplasmataceae bacterium]
MDKAFNWIRSDKFKSRVLPEIQRGVSVIIFTIIYGVGVAWFLEASVVPLYTGGIPGIGQLVRDILTNILGYTLPGSFLGLFVVIFNIPILILGWVGVSHRFTIYSLMSVLVQSVMFSLIPHVDMGLATTEHALTSAIIGGLLIGIGTGGALRFGTSTGGLDIIAQYLAFKKGKSVGYFSMAMNVTIAILGGLIIGGTESTTGIIVSGGVITSYTVIRIIVSTVITDRMHTAYQYLSVNIITLEPKALVDDVLNNLYRGVTLIKVEGAYSHHEKTMVYVIISSYELHQLSEIIKKIDPHAFVVTTPVKNVYGNFKHKTIA